MDIQHAAKLRGDGRKPRQVRFHLGSFLALLAQTEFLVDERDQGLAFEAREPGQIPADVDLLARFPAHGHVGAKQGEPGSGMTAGLGEEGSDVGPARGWGRAATRRLEPAGERHGVGSGGVIPGAAERGGANRGAARAGPGGVARVVHALH